MTMKLSIISGWTGRGEEEEEAIIIPDKIAPFFFLLGKMMCSLFFYYGGWRIVSDLDDNLIDFRFISFSFSGSGSWRRPSGRRRVEDQRSGRWIAIGAVTAGRRAAAAATTIGRWRRVIGGWESLQQQTERSQSRRHPRHHRRSPTNRSATRVDRLRGERKRQMSFSAVQQNLNCYKLI